MVETGEYVTQNPALLKLLLLEGDWEPEGLTVFHSRSFHLSQLNFCVDIIGESHRIKVKPFSGQGVTEILACLPEEGGGSPLLVKGLSHPQPQGFFRKTGPWQYHFSFQKKGFDEKDYSSFFKTLIKKPGEVVGYNFATGEKDHLESPYSPATWVLIEENRASVKWTSLHIYPNEKTTLISCSTISIDEKGSR